MAVTLVVVVVVKFDDFVMCLEVQEFELDSYVAVVAAELGVAIEL